MNVDIEEETLHPNHDAWSQPEPPTSHLLDSLPVPDNTWNNICNLHNPASKNVYHSLVVIPFAYDPESDTPGLYVFHCKDLNKTSFKVSTSILAY
jgi:hypothetical protein